MKYPLLIFPYNGNGLEALDCLGDDYELAGFIDDDPEKQGTSPRGFNVYSRVALQQYPEAKVLAVPGSPATFLRKKALISSLNLPEQRYASVLHPSARISSLAKLGYNTLIMAGVVITSNAIIGNHTIVLPNSVIHHDVSVGDYTSIGSVVVIAGRTTIGSGCYIGSASSIINDISVGDDSLIGMGSNVIHSLPMASKVAGNPAKPL